MAGAEIAVFAARHRLRAAFAGDLLPRRVSGLRRTIRHQRIFGRPADSSGHQLDRHHHHDCDSDPDIVVQRDRRAKPRGAHQIAERRFRGRRRMKLVIAVVAAIALLEGAAAAVAEPADSCDVPDSLIASEVDLTQVTKAVNDTHRLSISVIGTTSSSLSGPDGARTAYPARLEDVLKQRLTGIDIKVIAHVQAREITADM